MDKCNRECQKDKFDKVKKYIYTTISSFYLYGATYKGGAMSSFIRDLIRGFEKVEIDFIVEQPDAEIEKNDHVVGKSKIKTPTQIESGLFFTHRTLLVQRFLQQLKTLPSVTT